MLNFGYAITVGTMLWTMTYDLLLIFCCIKPAALTPSAFQWAEHPPKLPLSTGISATFNTWSLGLVRVNLQAASELVQLFLQSSWKWPTHEPSYSVATSRIWCTEWMRYGLIRTITATITRKHRQSYRHADPCRQRPQVGQGYAVIGSGH